MIDLYLWWLSIGWNGRLLVFVVIALVIVVAVLGYDAWKKRRGVQ